MNVSMMDSFNLAWKLIYSINGLTPDSAIASESGTLLDTYHTERHTVAQQLIDFDRTFSSMFSGKMGSEQDGIEGLTHDQFLDVFSTGNGFTSGCGVEYPENPIVNRTVEKDGKNPVQGTDLLSGILYPGRRLLNVQIKRHADGNRRDLQDGMLSIKMAKSHRGAYSQTNHRFPLNRPLPHPLPNINRPPRPHRHIIQNPNHPRLIHHPPLPQIHHRTSRSPPPSISGLHLAGCTPGTQTDFRNAVLQWL